MEVMPRWSSSSCIVNSISLNSSITLKRNQEDDFTGARTTAETTACELSLSLCLGKECPLRQKTQSSQF